MKYFLDTEFIDTGTTIDLISIGIVAEDGRELYLQSVEFDEEKASTWVKEHVLPHLLFCPSFPGIPKTGMGLQEIVQWKWKESHRSRKCQNTSCLWRTREQIKDEVLAFMDIAQYGTPELYGWCSSYDHVALCQLFGTMMDIPAGWPHYIKDLQYLLDERGIVDDQLPVQEEGTHNALADAKHIQKLFRFVSQQRGTQEAGVVKNTLPSIGRIRIGAGFRDEEKNRCFPVPLVMGAREIVDADTGQPLHFIKGIEIYQYVDETTIKLVVHENCIDLDYHIRDMEKG